MDSQSLCSVANLFRNVAFIITIEGTADVDLDVWFNYNVELVSDRGDIFEQLGIFSDSVLVLGHVQISIPSYRACAILGIYGITSSAHKGRYIYIFQT